VKNYANTKYRDVGPRANKVATLNTPINLHQPLLEIKYSVCAEVLAAEWRLL